MTDKLAFIIALTLLACITGDLVLRGGEDLVYLSRKFLEFLEWIAFWR